MTDTVYQKAKRALARMIRRECENNNDSDDYVPIDHAIDAGEKAEKRAAEYLEILSGAWVQLSYSVNGQPASIRQEGALSVSEEISEALTQANILECVDQERGWYRWKDPVQRDRIDEMDRKNREGYRSE